MDRINKSKKIPAALILAIFAFAGLIFCATPAAAEMSFEYTNFQMSEQFSVSGASTVNVYTPGDISEKRIQLHLAPGVTLTSDNAGPAAQGMLKFGQHYPGLFGFVEHWSLEELTAELLLHQGESEIDISSTGSDVEEEVFGTYGNPIKVVQSADGSWNYFLASTNGGGSIVVQDWNTSFFQSTSNIDGVYIETLAYGVAHSTPISSEREAEDVKSEIEGHDLIYRQTVDTNSLLYKALVEKGVDPTSIAFRSAEINVDTQKGTFWGSSIVPHEIQQELGLTDIETTVLGKVLSLTYYI